MSLKRTILGFGLVVLAFDVVWETLSRIVANPFGSLGWVAFLLTLFIYTAAGMVAAAGSGSFSDGPSAGVAVGAIDALLGGLLLSLIGRTQVLEPVLWASLVLSTIVGIGLGALFGTIGAACLRLPFVASRLGSKDI